MSFLILNDLFLNGCTSPVLSYSSKVHFQIDKCYWLSSEHHYCSEITQVCHEGLCVCYLLTFALKHWETQTISHVRSTQLGGWLETQVLHVITGPRPLRASSKHSSEWRMCYKNTAEIEKKNKQKNPQTNRRTDSLIGCIKPSTDSDMPAGWMEGTALLSAWCCYANLCWRQLGLQCWGLTI